MTNPSLKLRTLPTTNIPAQNANEFLNAYEIVNVGDLHWPVTIYNVTRLDGYSPNHTERGGIKDIIWKLRSQFKEKCMGFGFVIDISETGVIVPSTWAIPEQEDFDGYRVTLSRQFEANATDVKCQPIIAGIIRESIKRRFRIPDNEIGPLWQDYGDFCQSSIVSDVKGDIAFCRKFNVSPELLYGDKWSIQIAISTRTVDVRSLADYYQSGEVTLLAEKLQLKLANRSTRKNDVTAVRVLHVLNFSQAEVLEIENPAEIITQHALLDPADQQSLATQTIRCSPYKKPPVAVLLKNLRLILDTQITQQNHDETIINPDERVHWQMILRNFLDSMDAYGQSIHLSSNPIPISEFDSIMIAPPAIRLRTAPDQIGILPAPSECTQYLLRKRAKARVNLIRQYGFLEQRPINPILAWPKKFDIQYALRLQRDLNSSLRQQGFEFQFDRLCLYDSVYEIRKAVQEGDHDSLIAVLPESAWDGVSDNDTHDKIKKEIQVPSQCIYYDNTLPRAHVKTPWRELKREEPHLAQQIQNRYQLCLWNLLVKHHWVPFAPQDAFHYNVHVGIDVGGKHNNRVMACIGYGFQKPEDSLVFLPRHINVEVQQAEPIPPNALHDGLVSLFEQLHQRLSDAGVTPDFSRVLFFRDGELRGHGDDWNEIDVLKRLRNEFFSERKWIPEKALWTAAEVSKRAGYWRIMRNENGMVRNPVVGRCIFPFTEENTGLVCTSGSPYLSQGTASPLLVRIKDIYGQSSREEVMKDLVWEADMCFTKVDMGRSLPWVLHVANSGALQQSKAYQITGITT